MKTLTRRSFLQAATVLAAASPLAAFAPSNQGADLERLMREKRERERQCLPKRIDFHSLIREVANIDHWGTLYEPPEPPFNRVTHFQILAESESQEQSTLDFVLCSMLHYNATPKFDIEWSDYVELEFSERQHNNKKVEQFIFEPRENYSYEMVENPGWSKAPFEVFYRRPDGTVLECLIKRGTHYNGKRRVLVMAKQVGPLYSALACRAERRVLERHLARRTAQ